MAGLDVTALLGGLESGDRTALNLLLPLVFWRTAKAWLNRERGAEIRP